MLIMTPCTAAAAPCARGQPRALAAPLAPPPRRVLSAVGAARPRRRLCLATLQPTAPDGPEDSTPAGSSMLSSGRWEQIFRRVWQLDHLERVVVACGVLAAASYVSILWMFYPLLYFGMLGKIIWWFIALSIPIYAFS